MLESTSFGPTGSRPFVPRRGVGRGLRAVAAAAGVRTLPSDLAPAWRGRPDGVQIANLRSLSDGEEDFVQVLWRRHRPEIQVLLLGLVRAVSAADPGRARGCLHTLRGGLGFFGAVRLERLGRMLGRHLAFQGTPGCLPLLVAFLSEAERLLVTLDGLEA